MKRFLYIFIVFTSLFLLASCGEGSEKITMDETEISITYDGVVVSWNTTEVDSKYFVQINNEEEKAIDSNKYTYTSDFDFSVTVKVIRVAGEEEQTFIKTENFNIVGTTDNFNFVNGELTWDSVEGANSYKIEIDGNIVEEENTSRKYKIGVSGNYNVRVKANGLTNKHFSYWSNEFKMSILSTPERVNYNTETGVITWNKVLGAQKYVVRINNEEFETFDNTYDYKIDETDFSVEVKAIGKEEENVFESEYSQVQKYQFLDVIESYTVENGVISWPAVDGATGYTVQVNNNDPIDIRENKYSGLIYGTSYIIKIKPFTNEANSFSYWFTTQPINILATPEIKYSIGNEDKVLVSWNPITNADGYKVLITRNDEIVLNDNVTTSYFEYPFKEVGAYEIEVKSDSIPTSEYYDSKYSNKLSIYRLGASPGKKIVDNPLEDSATIITVDNVFKAKGFQLEIDDMIDYSYKEDTRQFFLNESKGNNLEGFNIKIQIRSKGGIEKDGTLVLDSIETLNFDLTKLAVPVLSINNGFANWGTIISAKGYVFDVQSERQVIGETNNHELNIKQAGKYDVRLRAMGNGENVISSDFSNPVTVTKLKSPTITIQNEKAEWEKIDGAQSYHGKVGENEVLNTDINILSLSEHARADQRFLTLIAKGDDKAILDSEPAISEPFYRLDDVKEFKVKAGNFVWNKVNNAIGYDIYVNGNSFGEIFDDMGSLPENGILPNHGDYQVSIKAIGDGKKYFDSILTNQFTVTKLETPNIVRENGYNLEWTSVSKAAGYNVSVSGQDPYKYLPTQFSHNLVFDSLGKKQIILTAVGNDSDVINSNPLILDLESVKMPQVEWTAEFNQDENNLKMVVDIDNYDFEYKHLTKWIFNYGSDKDTTTNSIEYTYGNVIGRQYNHSVSAEGKFLVFNNDNIKYYIQSEKTYKTITTYDAPKNIKTIVDRTGSQGIGWESNHTSSKINATFTITLKDGTVLDPIEIITDGKSHDFRRNDIKRVEVTLFVQAGLDEPNHLKFNSKKITQVLEY